MDDQLPPLLMTSEPGSFARKTIVERKPLLIRQAIEDNGYSPKIMAALEAFRQEIAGQSIRLLTEDAEDVGFWNEEASAYAGRTWLELPWYFAEAYFYRRLLEATHFFQAGAWQGHDPFGLQKHKQAQAAVAWLADSERAAQEEAAEEEGPQDRFSLLLHSALWGNRADMSNYTVREQVPAGQASRQERQHILIDHTQTVAGLLAAGVARVDFVNDNTGRELLFDLTLANHLLEQGWVDQVVLHLKGWPFFVSDAMSKDVLYAISLLEGRALGWRLDEHLARGRLVLRDEAFWTTHLMFRAMPPELVAELSGADLVILKGDVNYRRLLGDRHWPHTARLEEIAAYFPAPLLVLRTLKGEIIVGLAPGQAESLSEQEPDWLFNGKRGIVQFVDKGRAQPHQSVL
jgi:uncharacterized protein with ATP-grasp and redox domains